VRLFYNPTIYFFFSSVLALCVVSLVMQKLSKIERDNSRVREKQGAKATSKR